MEFNITFTDYAVIIFIFFIFIVMWVSRTFEKWTNEDKERFEEGLKDEEQ